MTRGQASFLVDGGEALVGVVQWLRPRQALKSEHIRGAISLKKGGPQLRPPLRSGGHNSRTSLKLQFLPARRNPAPGPGPWPEWGGPGPRVDLGAGPDRNLAA